MMRNALTLLLIGTWLVCAARVMAAQTYTFGGNDVGSLASAVVEDVKQTNTFHPSYYLARGEKHSSTFTAPMVFEILACTIAQWKNNAPFPATVSGIAFDLKPPEKYHPEFDPPPGEHFNIPLIPTDIPDNAVKILTVARSMNGLPAQVVFRARYKMTSAQFLVAMAFFIQAWQQSAKLPDSMAIPAVYSPPDWVDVKAPQRVELEPVVVVETLALRCTLNGVEIPRPDDQGNVPDLPDALSQPFCGTVQIGLVGSGPIGRITVALDGVILNTYDKAGTYAIALDTAQYADATHILAVSMTDAQGKHNYPLILSLVFQNGHDGAFTPADQSDTGTPSPSTFDTDY